VEDEEEEEAAGGAADVEERKGKGGTSYTSGTRSCSPVPGEGYAISVAVNETYRFRLLLPCAVDVVSSVAETARLFPSRGAVVPLVPLRDDDGSDTRVVVFGS